MNIVTLDFETYFDAEFSLDKLTTEEYVRDPRFEVHGCGVASHHADWNEGWLGKSEVQPFFEAVIKDVPDVTFLAHHAHFDGLILAHHFGIRPAGWLDTLSMSRLMLGNHVRKSLDSLRQHFGMPAKRTPYHLFKGKHWHEISYGDQQQIASGCIDEVESIWRIFHLLAAEFPAEEYGVIDATVRMFTEPVVMGDTDLLAQVWMDEDRAKRDLLQKLLPGLSFEDAEAQLQSNELFAQLLKRVGVEPEWKAGKNGPIYAFAKSDDFMRDLQEDDVDTVRMLAEARISAKSTISQTRAGRLGFMSTRGAMCVYINYCGAHTTRDSGGDKVNWQNFPRPRFDDPGRGRIRRSMCAPPGYLIGVVDASQIECRMLNEFAGQDDICEKFRQKRDLYAELASDFYQTHVYKPESDDPRKAEMEAKRGTGKQLELSCGYGAGDLTIQVTAAKGTYGPPVALTLDEARAAKLLYRRTHRQVEALWGQGNEWLACMFNWISGEWGCLRIECDADRSRRRIILPNGAPIIYDALEWYVPTTDEELAKCKPFEYNGYWRMITRKGYVKLYGAKMVENVIQAIARVHVFQVMLRLRAAGIKIWLRNHDELAMVLPIFQQPAERLEWCRQEMATPPRWMPNVPLDAEVKLGERYEK